MKYFYVTANKNKLAEFEHAFPFEFEYIRLELPEIQGRIKEIAKQKALAAFDAVNCTDDYIVITDDVSLEIKALNNFPGPYIKHFEKIGTKKIEQIMNCFENKKATAHCTLGICYKKNNKKSSTIISGCVEGKLKFVKEIVNTNAFGFDTYFVPDLFTKTYAEMTLQEKNVNSHRGKAIYNLIEFIKDNKLNE